MASTVDAQRMVALQAGNAVRMERAQIKRDLKTGKLTITDLFVKLPKVVHAMPIAELITWCPGIGGARGRTGKKVFRIMDGVIRDGHAPAAAIPPRHRRVLADRLQPYQTMRLPS